MANNYFTFKQFTVRQEHTAMKVGTDGVLLGALTRTEETSPLSILDIGTGTGLVALMLAQRMPQAMIEAIDIEEDAAAEAADNFAASPFADRLKSICSDAITFNPSKRYNIIVSNPPYYDSSLVCPNQKRTLARHSIGLNYNELASVAANLLLPTGRLALIVPTNVISSVIKACAMRKLILNRRTDIYPTPSKPPKRVVAEFSFAPCSEVFAQKLVLETAPRVRSSEYKLLTKDFYLDK